MNRTFSLCLAAVLVTGSALAQTAQPAPQPPPNRKPARSSTGPTRKDHKRAGVGPGARPCHAARGTARRTAHRALEAVGNTSVASDTIRVYLGVNPAIPTIPPRCSATSSTSADRLFDDIRLETDNAPNGGVIVRAVVKERPRIGAVEYRGNKELNAAKITEQLEKDKIDLHVGNTLEQTLVRRAAESIKKAYSEGGFEGVTVDTTMEDMTEGDKKIVFNVSEGIKATVARIVFTGNQHFSSRRLKKQMKEVKENNVVTWIRKKNLYIPSKLDEDLEHVKNYYQDYGYNERRVRRAATDDDGSAKKPRVRITIPIKEGTIHRLGDVTVTGTTVFKPEAFTGNFPVKKGDIIRRKRFRTASTRSMSCTACAATSTRTSIPSTSSATTTSSTFTSRSSKASSSASDGWSSGQHDHEGQSPAPRNLPRRGRDHGHGDLQAVDLQARPARILQGHDNPDFKVNQEKKTVDVT